MNHLIHIGWPGALAIIPLFTPSQPEPWRMASYWWKIISEGTKHSLSKSKYIPAAAVLFRGYFGIAEFQQHQEHWVSSPGNLLTIWSGTEQTLEGSTFASESAKVPSKAKGYQQKSSGFLRSFLFVCYLKVDSSRLTGGLEGLYSTRSRACQLTHLFCSVWSSSSTAYLHSDGEWMAE